MSSDLVLSDDRPKKKCQHCAELILEEATVCRFCNRDVAGKPQAATRPDESLAQAMLLVPLLGCILIWFWIGSMSLIQGPGSSLALVGVGTVLITGFIAATDAKRLGVGAPGDPLKGSSPNVWFLFILLLWIVGYPAYLFQRKKYGARSYIVVGVLIALLFAGSWFGMSVAIEAQQEKIRGIFNR
jgi:RNA polymerase subunit RPABC4/transcription elongation factor Spt4